MANRTKLTTLRVISVFLVALGVAATAAGGTIYVDVDAGGANNGSSWTDAYRYVQDGLAGAWSGDEIRVAQGVYIPDQNSANPGGSGDREATFQLITGVTIKGGYAGPGEPDPNERDVEAYETVLSGDLAGNDGPDFANNDENSYHVVTGSNTDGTTVLDGFTITAGNANGSPRSNQHGGGMYNGDGSPTLINCIFRGNMATGAWCRGGGMYSDSGSPVLTNCIFSGNFADASGGMHCGGVCDSPRLTNCIFIGNRTGGNGGGLRNNSLNMTLTNCMFIGNSAGGSGGGLLNQRWDGYVTLTNCMFLGNTAQQRDGGGMFSEHTVQIVTNCTFSGNSAGRRGGGIYNVMGNYGGYQEITTLTNCILRDNSAEEGPEIALYSHETSISYCNIQGGRLDIYIVNENPERYLTWDENSNIDADPCFVMGRLGDYYLSHTAAGQAIDSPCVDAGSDTAANLGVDIFTTRTDQVVDAGTVDMGYHYPITNVADIDGDWEVDFVDFSILASQWQQAPGIPSADIEPANGNGIVDFLDLGLLVDNWLWEK